MSTVKTANCHGNRALLSTLLQLGIAITAARSTDARLFVRNPVKGTLSADWRQCDFRSDLLFSSSFICRFFL